MYNMYQQQGENITSDYFGIWRYILQLPAKENNLIIVFRLNRNIYVYVVHVQ